MTRLARRATLTGRAEAAPQAALERELEEGSRSFRRRLRETRVGDGLDLLDFGFARLASPGSSGSSTAESDLHGLAAIEAAVRALTSSASHGV